MLQYFGGFIVRVTSSCRSGSIFQNQKSETGPVLWVFICSNKVILLLLAKERGKSQVKKKKRRHTFQRNQCHGNHPPVDKADKRTGRSGPVPTKTRLMDEHGARTLWIRNAHQNASLHPNLTSSTSGVGQHSSVGNLENPRQERTAFAQCRLCVCILLGLRITRYFCKYLGRNHSSWHDIRSRSAGSRLLLPLLSFSAQRLNPWRPRA